MAELQANKDNPEWKSKKLIEGEAIAAVSHLLSFVCYHSDSPNVIARSTNAGMVAK